MLSFYPLEELPPSTFAFMATVTNFKLVTPPESSRADKPGATKASDAFQEKKSVSVNYDRGEHEVSVRVGGLRKADIPRRYRNRVENDRFQKDWSVSEVVDRLMALNRWEEVDGVLNSWVGRFARKNFPVLIRVCVSRLIGLSLMMF